MRFPLRQGPRLLDLCRQRRTAHSPPGVRAMSKKALRSDAKPLPYLLLELGKGSIFVHLIEGVIDGIC